MFHLPKEPDSSIHCGIGEQLHSGADPMPHAPLGKFGRRFSRWPLLANTRPWRGELAKYNNLASTKLTWRMIWSLVSYEGGRNLFQYEHSSQKKTTEKRQQSKDKYDEHNIQISDENPSKSNSIKGHTRKGENIWTFPPPNATEDSTNPNKGCR